MIIGVMNIGSTLLVIGSRSIAPSQATTFDANDLAANAAAVQAIQLALMNATARVNINNVPATVSSFNRFLTELYIHGSAQNIPSPLVEPESLTVSLRQTDFATSDGDPWIIAGARYYDPAKYRLSDLSLALSAKVTATLTGEIQLWDHERSLQIALVTVTSSTYIHEEVSIVRPTSPTFYVVRARLLGGDSDSELLTILDAHLHRYDVSGL